MRDPPPEVREWGAGVVVRRWIDCQGYEYDSFKVVGEGLGMHDEIIKDMGIFQQSKILMTSCGKSRRSRPRPRRARGGAARARPRAAKRAIGRRASSCSAA